MNKTGPTRNQRRKKVWARSATTRRLLDPLWLQDSLALNRGISPFMGGIAGLQAALSLLAAIVLVRHSLWPELVGFPALGALAALFGRHAPLVKRHGIVWMCAAQLTGAVFVTSLASYIGLSPAMMVLVVALVAATSTIIFSYWNLGVPGAVIIVFAAGAAMTPVDSWTMVVERTVATAGGGLVAWLITLGQITVTPMALLMTYLAMPGGSPADMAIERVFDTMLGAILGIVFAVIFSTIDDRRHLARYHRNRKSERRSGR